MAEKCKLPDTFNIESLSSRFIRVPLSNVLVNEDDQPVRYRNADLVHMIPTPLDSVALAHVKENCHLHQVVMKQQLKLETERRKTEQLLSLSNMAYTQTINSGVQTVSTIDALNEPEAKQEDSSLLLEYYKKQCGNLQAETDPRCIKAATQEAAHLHGSRPPRRIPAFQLCRHHYTMLRQSSTQSDATGNFTFNGDFFGTYSAEDFPGFEDDIIDGEGDDAEDSAQADDPAALEHTWEPARELQTVGADMEVDDFENLAQSTSRFHSSAGSLLQQLPAHWDGIHVQTFGALAGAPLMNMKLPTHELSSAYEHYQSKIPDGEANIWAPFISQMDWEVAQWAKMRGSGSTAFSDLLAIEGVMEALGLSYADSMELNGIIDNDLPSRRPPFTQSEVALYGNPEHSQYLCFAPEQHYADPDRTMHLYHDFNTGRWWWDTQRAIEENKPGATIIPIIILSDKTQVTLFQNKSAYPVYLTIGNLPKEIRCKPSQQGQILLAYLPSTRLEHISNKTARRRMVVNLFHSCMTSLVAPLKEAGLEGITMQSGDGVSRHCHPILASYVGDYPEQCLVTTCYSGDCPSCETEKEDLGLFPVTKPYRDFKKALDATMLIGTKEWADECLTVNLKPVQHPFWENLPYTDIFRSITPDILHQMYQGVMKHLISWLTDICGADEMDARVRRLPPNHNIRIFHKGISSLSRISGTEHKQMCSFILGMIVDIPQLTAVQSNALLAATRALLDFLYLACYSIHSSNTLVSLDESLAQFHSKREIFVELNIRENFNFPKLHFLSHDSRAIKYFGTTDNYNTDVTKRQRRSD
ncbi:hypothetical protein F5876DRAFT_81287 [Lentinula aff. lateritia]|uniref:Uncharacterized protein n=1 Tax=Lentinula aff. lateritia TaxID=2804960 RepID=A0ACC1TMP5_9AGAR|nr:hypothetical protein F5876DRAFT_81287 [Lentinula aff. lateritia]